MMAAFACAVVAVVDADTIRCGSGVRVRIAGISALERNGSCNSPRCPTMLHSQAKPIVERIAYQRRLMCDPVVRSYDRIVADCRLPEGGWLSCTIIASGAAVRWERYWRQYRLGNRCR